MSEAVAASEWNTRSDLSGALVAAAYEAAAQTHDDAWRETSAYQSSLIRALTPADARAALGAMLADAEHRGRDSVTVQDAAKVLMDACPNPIFDILKPVLMGEFRVNTRVFDEDGEEVWEERLLTWDTTKDVIHATLRALSGKADQ
ncbi:hypothetical protein ATI53_1001181 [Salipiger aestuarii]|uniref:Uncharacterized protein n=2 Tax=Salipiger aestuarii TaxID=568098 RepID=A0A327YSD2_9RHOB|nr:hypothetical protein ATI53_1001181 [Salipiger aestuarii]